MTTTEKPKKRGKKLWIIIGIVVIVVAIVGSLVYVANRPGTAPTPPTGPNVTIWDTGFCSNSGNCGYSANSKNVTLGTSITWTNTGGKTHTVTECTSADSATACQNGAGANASNSRAFDSNTQYPSGFGNGQQFTYAFTSSGTYYYYCSIHPWMHGTIIVS